MYKRLWIVSAVILIALAALCGLGLYSINTHANGLKAQRQAAFYEVAENIRVDVNRKFNDFLRTEQAVPYTHYQHFFTPVACNDADAILVSPLAQKFENGLTSEGTQKPVLSESGLFYVWEVFTNNDIMDIQYYGLHF